MNTRYDLGSDESVLTAEITFRHEVRFAGPHLPTYEQIVEHARQREYALKQFVSCREAP